MIVRVKVRSVAQAKAFQRTLGEKDYLWKSGFGMLYYPWLDLNVLSMPIVFVVNTLDKRVTFTRLTAEIERAIWRDDLGPNVIY